LKRQLDDKHRKTGTATREIKEIEMKIKKAARNIKVKVFLNFL
jgi:hypothetical protein